MLNLAFLLVPSEFDGQLLQHERVAGLRVLPSKRGEHPLQLFALCLPLSPADALFQELSRLQAGALLEQLNYAVCVAQFPEILCFLSLGGLQLLSQRVYIRLEAFYLSKQLLFSRLALLAVLEVFSLQLLVREFGRAVLIGGLSRLHFEGALASQEEGGG